MNPITSAIHEQTMLGRQVHTITPDTRDQATKATLYFTEGDPVEIAVCDDHRQFAELWDEAREYMKRMGRIVFPDALDRDPVDQPAT